MSRDFNRRTVLAGALAAPLLASLPAEAQDRPGLIDLELSDEEMLRMFVKLRSSLDDRVTMGWVDAVNYAFVQGVTYPLYRLLSTTLRQVRRVDDGLYKGVSLEVAMYVDILTGELLDTLTMPITGQTVDVPLYRSRPSANDITVRSDQTREFTMDDETRDGGAFFASGRVESRRFLSQPQRRGDDFYIRQDVSAQVFSGDDPKPTFFYREWTTNQGSWAKLSDPSLPWVPCDVSYVANTAFRPWMQMGDTPGHTVQNEGGGRAASMAELPVELRRLVEFHHPDLARDPQAVLAGEAG